MSSPHPTLQRFLHTFIAQTTSCTTVRLEYAGKEALVGGPGLHLLALAVDEVPVELTAAGINIHLRCPEPSGTLPEVTGDPESDNDEESEVRLEEIFGGTNALADGRDSSVELDSVSLKF